MWLTLWQDHLAWFGGDLHWPAPLDRPDAIPESLILPLQQTVTAFELANVASDQVSRGAPAQQQKNEEGADYRKEVNLCHGWPLW